ncbi:MAG: cadherin repeat domain-containing protein [Saccharospirillaceae bacterium]|nr:hypothetical protein [Pseudomonadales bacterium]NRB80424.1 cadherin repeat domain-containing protein [Saccharospirillaceae bacterium]
MFKLIGFYFVVILAMTSTFSFGHIIWDQDSVTPPRSDDNSVSCGAQLSVPPVFEANSLVDLTYIVGIKHYSPLEIHLYDDNDNQYILSQNIAEPPADVITMQTVNLPDIECESCYLYIKQTSSILYESCSDIRLVKQLESIPPETVLSVNSTQMNQNLNLTWDYSLEEDEKIERVFVLQSDSQINSNFVNGEIYNLGDTFAEAQIVYSAVLNEFEITNIKPDSVIYFQLVTQDFQYNYSEPFNYTVITASNIDDDNNEPNNEDITVEITGSLIVKPSIVQPSEILLTAVITGGNVNDSFTIEWSSTPALESISSPANTFYANSQANDFKANQSYVITVSVSDSAEPAQISTMSVIVEVEDLPLDINDQTIEDNKKGNISLIFLLGLMLMLLTRCDVKFLKIMKKG